VIFPLRRFPSRTPIPSLGGATARYKPLIPALVIGPIGQVGCQVLVDSAADDVVFPVSLAQQIGVDLTAAVQGQARGVGAPLSVSLVYAPVILLLDDGKEVARWRAVVGFTSGFLHFPLLGIAGGLEHFRTTLDVAKSEVILERQPSLPATLDPVP
jgi:hypothetical protein